MSTRQLRLVAACAAVLVSATGCVGVDRLAAPDTQPTQSTVLTQLREDTPWFVGIDDATIVELAELLCMDMDMNGPDALDTFTESAFDKGMPMPAAAGLVAYAIAEHCLDHEITVDVWANG